ncbi:MAG TPA: MBL fold metallo-hydrolase [Bacteroidales bacterium]|nr:MBL fold metallo-hydrolase [Bacteroidales bacterium]
MKTCLYNCVLIVFTFLLVQCTGSDNITPSLVVKPGSVNGVFIERNGKKLAVYGDPSGKMNDVDMVLFTHFRRDVVWAGRDLLLNGAEAVIPADEKSYFTGTDSIWKSFSEKRFHDYYCQTTKIMSSPVIVTREVRGGDVVSWEDIEIKVFPASGYTRNAVSYITEIDGKKIAFTGDMIYGNGQLFDLYSFQDSYQSIGGYHGYATRLGALITSLQYVADQKPDIIIPARGPVIFHPLPAIDTLIGRIRELYRNYLTISAYRWYYPERMTALAEHVPGRGNTDNPMPYSAVIRDDPPEWYLHISNSNLVVADDSSAFLIDCGTTDALEGVMELVKSGRIKSIDGIFITHYHDDHTDYINDVREKFNCPVYITEELKDILENPGSYQMPCLTKRSVNNLTVKFNEEKMLWKDFTLTFYYFPGQTFYHDAVLFDKHGGESIFFIGDSFTPSGIDDYCLLNRNLLHEGEGYFYCLDILKMLPEGTLLANQHVEPPFAYSADQIDFLQTKLIERNQLFSELFPWEDINYGIDEQWAKTYPYGQDATPGSSVEISVRLSNHTSVDKTFKVMPRLVNNIVSVPARISLKVSPGEEGKAVFKVKVPDNAVKGLNVITFDVGFDEWNMRDWCEALITVI